MDRKKVLIKKKISRREAHGILNEYILAHELQSGIDITLDDLLRDVLNLEDKTLNVFDLHYAFCALPTSTIEKLKQSDI